MGLSMFESKNALIDNFRAYLVETNQADELTDFNKFAEGFIEFHYYDALDTGELAELQSIQSEQARPLWLEAVGTLYVCAQCNEINGPTCVQGGHKPPICMDCFLKK